MLRVTYAVARKRERCRGSVFVITKNRLYLSTTTAAAGSRDKTSATAFAKDASSATTDPTGQHLVKNIEDDGYGTQNLTLPNL